MARPSNKAQRRQQLAEALLSLMAERGYEGTSVSEIAARAGLNQGLVYYHFKSKLEVLLAAVELLAQQHEARLDGAMAAADSAPWAQVEAYINAHLGLTATADAQALKSWIDVSSEALRRPEVQAPFRVIVTGLTARLATIIEQGVDEGVFTADPAAASAALVATIQGYLLLAGAAREVIPHGTAALSTIAMARGLLNVKEV